MPDSQLLRQPALIGCSWYLVVNAAHCQLAWPQGSYTWQMELSAVCCAQARPLSRLRPSKAPPQLCSTFAAHRCSKVVQSEPVTGRSHHICKLAVAVACLQQ